MVYAHSKSTTGKFEIHRFHNDVTKNEFTIVPEHGATLLTTLFNSKNVVDGLTTEEEIATLFYGKSIPLYPFPNRMRDGQFEHEGKKFQFPIFEDDGTKNAIHGFGKLLNHAVKDVKLSESSVNVTCECEYAGNLEYYPFPLKFVIVYNFSDGDGMTVTMTLTNTGKGTMPAALGWHPYFTINDNVNEVAMKFSCPVKRVTIDERMLPTGERTEFSAFQTADKIGTVDIDNTFCMEDTSKTFMITLEAKEGKLEFWQEPGSGKCNYTTIYIPPPRKSIALEPLTGNADCFNTKDGLQILKPGESITGKFGFKFTAAQ